ncbi:hypothetical protein [Ruminococcus sp.]|uniref:hypothetical protein n=1 Tax=Ruminococcus sp. TaxID=41978 RepID=UPI0039A2C1F4
MKGKVIKPALSSGYGGCAEQLIRLADKLPSEVAGQYGRPKMRAYRDDIDKTVDAVIASDQKLSGLWKQYNEMLDSRTEYLRKIYGEASVICTLHLSRTDLQIFIRSLATSYSMICTAYRTAPCFCPAAGSSFRK